MYWYRIYGLLVESEIPFDMAVSLSEEAGRYLLEQEQKVLIRWAKEEDSFPELQRGNREYSCINFLEQALIWVSQGKEIVVRPLEAYGTGRTVIQYIISEAIPTILYQRGVFTLHGSGIAYGDGAIVITGFSGSGKSSLADEFLNNGYFLLADDTVAITVEKDNIFGQPAFPQRKLCGDVVERRGLDKSKLIDLEEEPPKYAVSMWEQYVYEPRQFLALVQIEPYDGEQVLVEEITGGEKLAFLMKASYKYMLYAINRPSKDEIQQLVEICNKVNFYVIYRPRQGDSTKEQRELLEKILG